MTFRGDIALFDASDEGWLDPCAPGFLMGTNKKEGDRRAKTGRIKILLRAPQRHKYVG